MIKGYGGRDGIRTHGDTRLDFFLGALAVYSLVLETSTLSHSVTLP